MASSSTESITLRIACRAMPETPASEGTLDVGIQDKAQAIHAGRKAKDGAFYFDCAVETRIDGVSKELDFRGSIVHGTPQGRFLYLSWKRRTVGAAPWYWRVKIPLTGLTEKDVSSMKSTEVILADITGRKPHATDPIIWKRSSASEA